LESWKASENRDSFRVENGAIVCDGQKAHLFYVLDEGSAPFENFELMADVLTTPGSNSGIYFHTAFQEDGWPTKGYEAQVLNSERDKAPGQYAERRMTGSLYGVRNLWKAPAEDNEWFEYNIIVQGKTIRIRIDGELVVDYTEPEVPVRLEEESRRHLSSGTFALQCHDPQSRVLFRNLRVRRLPTALESPGSPPKDLELNRQLVLLGRSNFPLFDLHVHLKKGLTLEETLARSREYGVTYGVAVNCGLAMPYPSEELLRQFLDSYEKPPQTYLAMQAEGREWLGLFSEDVISQFDYVFTDAMTWTDDKGRRMRLWIDEEVHIVDNDEFMETLVGRIEGILDNEPIDIYVNPTYVPDRIHHLYDELWTPDRRARVIEALERNEVALEINNARRIPSLDFIREAKAARVKFTCGTNNAGPGDLGNQEYCLEAIQACELEANDMWTPPPKT
jgi:hypothetical protein